MMKYAGRIGGGGAGVGCITSIFPLGSTNEKPGSKNDACGVARRPLRALAPLPPRGKRGWCNDPARIGCQGAPTLMDSRSGQPLARDAMAYVLAGGRGSRLNELTDIRAKPAVYFGGKARIIDFALSNALNSGIRRIGVATQYKAHSLIRRTCGADGTSSVPSATRASTSCRPHSGSRRRSGTTAPPTRCSRTSTSSRATRRDTSSSSRAITSTRWTTSRCSATTSTHTPMSPSVAWKWRGRRRPASA